MKKVSTEAKKDMKYLEMRNKIDGQYPSEFFENANLRVHIPLTIS